jgi:glutaminyl-tRNA synthetase
MPTLNGLRRRGYSAKTLNTFCDVIGVARRGGEVWTAVNVLEQCCREELDAEAQRRFVVVDPVKVTLTNVAADFVEHVMLPNNPRDESAGKRSVALCNTLYLERSDFREDGADDRDFFGLAPGKTVMLR